MLIFDPRNFLSPGGGPLKVPLWGPLWFSFYFISSPRRHFFNFNFALVIGLFWRREFFIPRRVNTLVVPYGVPIWSLSVLYLLGNFFFGFQFCPGNRPFLTPAIFYIDGWVMGDGWVMDGWWAGRRSPKKSRILKISQKLFDIFS